MNSFILRKPWQEQLEQPDINVGTVVVLMARWPAIEAVAVFGWRCKLGRHIEQKEKAVVR
ncbi:MAG: hypothetical protein DCF23_05205 [Cyanobium sp.]|nr:MAG: hypothetical protein DCF23_05205 [Cyanobium sp.]